MHTAVNGLHSFYARKYYLCSLITHLNVDGVCYLDLFTSEGKGEYRYHLHILLLTTASCIALPTRSISMDKSKQG